MLHQHVQDCLKGTAFPRHEKISWTNLDVRRFEIGLKRKVLLCPYFSGLEWVCDDANAQSLYMRGGCKFLSGLLNNEIWEWAILLKVSNFLQAPSRPWSRPRFFRPIFLARPFNHAPTLILVHFFQPSFNLPPTSPSVSGGEWGQRGEAGGCQERSHHAMSRCYYPPTTTYSVYQICVYMYNVVYTEVYTIYIFTTERVTTMPWVVSLCYPTHQTKPNQTICTISIPDRTEEKQTVPCVTVPIPTVCHGFFHAMRPYYQCQEMALPHAIHRQLTHNSPIKQRSDGSWKDEKEKRPKDER